MTQTLTKLDMHSLGEMDNGATGLIVTHSLTAICRDCINRPNVKGKRKLTIQVEFTPVSDGHDCVKINIVPKVKSSIPIYEAPPMVAIPKVDHMAIPKEGDDGDIEE